MKAHMSPEGDWCALFFWNRGDRLTLREFFTEYPKIALAFSGGVDSAYLLYAAKEYAEEICAYYVKSEFQPQFELDDAMKLAEMLNIDMKILSVDVLTESKVKNNPVDRCYYCKKKIYDAIVHAAKEDGFSVIVDGTNASDDAGDRPGMKVLQELAVFSPLRMCGLTKKEIRRLSREVDLFTWNKPAYACLATRIPTGEEITLEKLNTTEMAEDFLFSLGFSDFRVRYENGGAKLQLQESQLALLIEHRKEILNKLKEKFQTVVLDLEVRE